MEEIDVAVVGLGTAGAAAAALCAERGLSVVGFERSALGDAGARWANGVTGWSFDEAGIPRSTGDELLGDGMQNFHLIAGWGLTRVVVHGRDVLEVDMRLLVDRLQGMAADAGADLRQDCAVRGWDGQVLDTDAGPIRPKWVVDASGMKGAGLVEIPPIRERNICTAAQEARKLADREAGLKWCHDNGGEEGDSLCFTGVAGGYSIINVQILGDRVSILTGSMANQTSGRALLDQFVADHPWVGARISGGARAIPVGMPRRRLAHGKVALIGDVAGQVYAAHGSGIGVHLVAARLLADALASGRGPASYGRRWWRRFAAPMVVSARFARFSRTLSPETIGALIDSGMMSEAMCRATMEQRPPRLRDLPPLARSTVRFALSSRRAASGR